MFLDRESPGQFGGLFEGVVIATLWAKKAHSDAKSFKNMHSDLYVKFAADFSDRYWVCVRLVGMVRRTRRTVGNESDEDVPVSNYSDDSDFEELQPSDSDDDPISRCI